MKFEIEEVTMASGAKHYNLFGFLDGDVHSTLISQGLGTAEMCRERAHAYLGRQVLERKIVEKMEIQ